MAAARQHQTLNLARAQATGPNAAPEHQSQSQDFRPPLPDDLPSLETAHTTYIPTNKWPPKATKAEYSEYSEYLILRRHLIDI